MFGNPPRLLAFAIVTVAALGVETYLLKCVLGVGNPTVFWVILVQAAIVHFMVASVDPTYGGGYLFAVVCAVVALSAPSSFAHKPLIKEGVFFGMICISTMAVTYRVRRWRNHHRARGY